MRAAADEWWTISDDVRSGFGAWLIEFVFNTLHWIMWHSCPIWTMRDPNWTGPHVVAWTVVASLLESATVITAALLSPAPAPSAPDNVQQGELVVLTMVHFICIPALGVSCISLALFFLALEPCYRRTFFMRDSRHAFHRRHWVQFAKSPALPGTADKDRAHFAGCESLRYLGDLASAWIVQGAAEWIRTQPSWCTEQWRDGVRKHVHFLGERAPEVLARGGVEQAR